MKMEGVRVWAYQSGRETDCHMKAPSKKKHLGDEIIVKRCEREHNLDRRLTGGVDGVFEKKLSKRRCVNTIVSTNTILIWTVLLLSTLCGYGTALPDSQGYGGESPPSDSGELKTLKFPGNIFVGPCGSSDTWRGTTFDRKEFDATCWSEGITKRIMKGYGTKMISAMPADTSDDMSVGGVRLGWDWAGLWYETWILLCYEPMNDKKIRAWTTGIAPGVYKYADVMASWKKGDFKISLKSSC